MRVRCDCKWALLPPRVRDLRVNWLASLAIAAYRLCMGDGRRVGVVPTRVFAVFHSRRAVIGTYALPQATFTDGSAFLRALVREQMRGYLGSFRPPPRT